MSRRVQTWEPMSPQEKYGYKPPSVAAGQPSVDLHAVPSPSKDAKAAASMLSPEGPLFWIGAILAVTFGAAAFSTNVRVGNARAGVSVGDPK